MFCVYLCCVYVVMMICDDVCVFVYRLSYNYFA